MCSLLSKSSSCYLKILAAILKFQLLPRNSGCYPEILAATQKYQTSTLQKIQLLASNPEILAAFWNFKLIAQVSEIPNAAEKVLKVESSEREVEAQNT